MTEERRIEAAEYVLGTLSAPERAAFARRLAADPAAQIEAAEWARRFTELLDPLDPVAPSPQVWATIRERVGASAPAPADNVVAFRAPASRRQALARVRWGSTTGIGSIAAAVALFAGACAVLGWPDFGAAPNTQVAKVETAPPASTAARATRQPADATSPPAQLGTGRPGVSIAGATPGAGSVSLGGAASGSGHVDIASATPGAGSVSLGGAASGSGHVDIASATPGAGSVSLGNAAPGTGSVDTGNMVADRAPAAASTAPGGYVATLAGGGGAPAVVVRIDAVTGALTVRTVAAAVPPGKSLELWYLAAGMTPRAIGVISDASSRLALPTGVTTDGASLGASLEPESGSPTGAPTGPLLYQGEIYRD